MIDGSNMLSATRHAFLHARWLQVSAASVANDLGVGARVLVVGGCSKSYAMTGFRIGWLLGKSTHKSPRPNSQPT